MPNIGSVLRDEILRLSRKETRSQVDPTRKVTARQRRDIAELKRQVEQLQRQVALLLRKTLAAPAAAAESTAPRMRFNAKGLRTHRERLGLSAGELGKLVGVSAQSIYNWELGNARPRPEQLSKVAVLRGMGKREAQARLERLAAGSKAGKSTK
ncbi:MAG: helix-turn-helix transcriptional regulator [Burkholderiales bacterium]|nr:helix-turn-helix transcriptional regulator [Burkholderiales bacterium]